MTGAPDESHDDDGQLPLVAEYALGLLDTDAHADMAARIADDPSLQRELAFWQQRLARMDDQFAPVTPPAHLKARLENALFDPQTQRPGLFSRLWNSVALWRGLAAGGVAMAVVAIGFAVVPLLTPQTGTGVQFAANLAAKDSAVSFVAYYDQARGTIQLSGVSGAPVPDKDYELWYIKGKAAPIALGVVPVNKPASIALSPDLRAGLGPDVTLAVTLEPKGGAPAGKPTGPLVAAGAVTPI